jgi:hypothetical protein
MSLGKVSFRVFCCGVNADRICAVPRSAMSCCRLSWAAVCCSADGPAFSSRSDDMNMLLRRGLLLEDRPGVATPPEGDQADWSPRTLHQNGNLGRFAV